jgi:hypothetical protein
MSTRTVSNHRRRQLALGALTVLLHVLVFDWFSGHVGHIAERRFAPSEPVEAQLLAQEPAPPAPPPDPVPPPHPAPEPPPPLSEVKPETLPPLDEAAVPAPALAAADGAADTPADAAPAQQGAAAAPAVVESQQAQAPAVPPEVAPQPAAPAPRRYKTDPPPPADIAFDVLRVEADGTKWNGDALLSWTLSPPGYRMRFDVGIRIVFAHVNLLSLTSEGTLGDEGFVPTLMTEKRRGRALTASHFSRDLGLLTFSASQAHYDIQAYAQDKASLPLQLAAIARGDPKQLTGTLDFQVAEDRNAVVYSFQVAGQEEIDTKLGRIPAWHLVRPPKPGAYHSRLDIWLAPGYGWYPVQIRNTEANGAVTTQTVSKIDNKKPGS